MAIKRVLSLIPLLLFLNISCAGPDLPDPLNDPVLADTSSITVQVTNPNDFDRPNEFIRLSLSGVPEDWQPDQLHWLEVVRLDPSGNNQVESAIMDWGTVLSSTGEIQTLGLVFIDDLPARDTNTYQIRLKNRINNSSDKISVEILKEGELGDLIRVQNGENSFFIGHELEPLDYEYNGQLPRDLYVRLEKEGGWSKVMPLSHIYFNIPEYREEFMAGHCEHLFVISPGLPIRVDISSNNLLARINLEYEGWAQSYCPPYDELNKPRQIDFYEAFVELIFYRDSSRVDAHTEIILRQGFYNHSGFAMGGVETVLDRPRVLFGDSNHTVLQGALWADTEEVTDRTEFMQIENNRYVFRRAATRDAFGPFELLAEVEGFLDYYVVEGQGDQGVFAYFPDFRHLAYRNLRNEEEAVVPVNMIGAGPSVPVMVANPIILSQSHLGKLGDLWVPIAPGKYAYDISADLSVPFDLQAVGLYDSLAARLSSPPGIVLVSDQKEASLSTATIPAPVPSTSTPEPSPTARPTPAAKSCNLPGYATNAGPLISGSYLEELTKNISSLQEGKFVIDNTSGQNYKNGDTGFYSIESPFSISFDLDLRSALFYISGRDAVLNPSWWGEGINNLYFSYDGGMNFYDGMSETSNDWISIGEPGNNVSYTVHFLEPCGKQFALHDGSGNLIGFFDVTRLQNTEFPDGLFPDGVIRFGVLLDPGGWMSISRLDIQVE